MPVQIPLETVGGLVACARPEDLPEGACPRTYDTDFMVGRWYQRPGLKSVFSYADAVSGPNAGDAAVNVSVTGNAWTNPNNVLVDDGAYAQCVPGTAGSDALKVTEFAFNLSPDVTPTGVMVPVKGFATSSVTLTAQLMLDGVAVGETRSAQLPMSVDTVMLGGAGDLWGVPLGSMDVNKTGFGVQITVSSSFPSAQALLGLVQMDVAQTVANADYHYLKSVTLDDGTVLTLAIDADGNWWMENVTENPGVLTLVMEGLTRGCYASSVTAQDGEFLCFSDLTTGADLPRKFTLDPQTMDRVSQVGPGAAPLFAASTNAAGASATITAFSVTSNVVTLTAANTFAAGQPVLFSGLTGAAFLNGKTLVVLGSGLSGSQFEVEFTHADVATTADAGTAIPQTNYPISTITQPAEKSYSFAYFLRSTGPGSTSPGSVITFYYQDSTTGAADADLVKAFASGQPVYLYVSFEGPVLYGPHTVLVTSMGLASPPGQPRQFYYFTFADPELVNAYTYFQGSGHPGYVANYQQTLATITTAEPVPVVNVGSQVTVADTSETSYDSTWPVTQALNSGSMGITQTQLTGGVATYSYNVVTGANPTAGQLVTITGTLNANGSLNGTDLVIASVTGTTSGIFTVAGFSAVTDYPAVAEVGQATTAGTMFTIDPGQQAFGTTSNPIYGSSTGGFLIFAGNGQLIGAGTRQGVVFFITRNGYSTCPSPPVTFTCPENTTAIQTSQIPIGPPNVVARGIAFTEAGANGIPGANFYTIPTPVQYIVEGVTYTATSLRINDNTSTSATFSFPDATLLEATAIDVQGNNLFNQIELGNPAWVRKYASRTAFGLCQNKLQNFLNLSFDGGYLPGGQLTPLGWTTPDAFGSLLVSPLFGNSYYIKNSSGGTLATAGLISQSAYEDTYLVSILVPNVAYSARVTARVPSGNMVGSLVVDLTSDGVGQGAFTLPFASMTDSFAIYEGELLATGFPTVPSSLLLRVYAEAIAASADVEIDRIEVFPTLQPVLTTDVVMSYPNNLEAFAIDTAVLDTSENNSQPCYGGAVVLDQFILLKEHSMLTTEDSPNEEPADWDPHELSQKVGTCGINGFDYGDEWLLTMEQSGVYGFNGGRPENCSRELQLQNGPQAGADGKFKGLWESIDWSQGQKFWLLNDLINRRFYCGVILPTPNFWLPKAPVNTNSQSPNVILMCNYEGCATFDELITATPMHTTIMGQLKALEQKRKWSIWQVPCPFAAQVKMGTGAELTTLLCNGIASGKIYELVPQQTTDDGVPIFPLYTTYGFDGNKQSTASPIGSGRKVVSYWTGNVAGNGRGGLRFYPNTLSATYPQTNPLPLRLQDPAQNDDERKVEVSGQRIFVEISGLGDGRGGGGYIEGGRITLDMAMHPWNPKRGITL